MYYNDMRHHSGQNVVDSRGAASCFFTTISTSKKMFFSERDQERDTEKAQA